MQVVEWETVSLFTCLRAWYRCFDLKQGDDIEITIAGERDLNVNRDRNREKALKRLRQTTWTLAPGWKFHCEEANKR